MRRSIGMAALAGVLAGLLAAGIWLATRARERAMPPAVRAAAPLAPALDPFESRARFDDAIKKQAFAQEAIDRISARLNDQNLPQADRRTLEDALSRAISDAAQAAARLKLLKETYGEPPTKSRDLQDLVARLQSQVKSIRLRQQEQGLTPQDREALADALRQAEHDLSEARVLLEMIQEPRWRDL